MTISRLTIYDDDQGRFGPITALRAIFLARTGARLTYERIEKGLGHRAAAFRVPDRLVEVTRQALPGRIVNQAPPTEGDQLFVNGRWAGLPFVEEVTNLVSDQALVQGGGQIVAVRLSKQDAARFLQSGCVRLPDHVGTIRLTDKVLLDRPWHLLDQLHANLMADLLDRDLAELDPIEQPGVMMFGPHAICVGSNAQLMPGAVVNSEQGPVVIDQGATVHSLAVLQGPCYVGPNSMVMPHASIRANTVIGPNCKVGGELSASILQGYSNKSHDGFLGDSLIGAWVNLGAGTNTSNLKNTYGPVRAQIDDGGTAINTGRTFLGSIIGDHVRTAIGTRLPTGAVIQTGCMLAGNNWAPKYAKALGFYRDEGRQPYDPDKLIATIKTAMARRDQALCDAERDLILRLAEAG